MATPEGPDIDILHQSRCYPVIRNISAALTSRGLKVEILVICRESGSPCPLNSESAIDLLFISVKRSTDAETSASVGKGRTTGGGHR